MIESVFIIILTSLVFLTIFQYATLFSSKIILSHAAARAARCRTVGFSEWMVEKSARVASIPAAGKRLEPVSVGIDPAISEAMQQNRIGDIWDLALRSNAHSPGTVLERGRVPDYLGSVETPSAQYILDYERWDSLSVNIDESLSMDGSAPGTATVEVEMHFPLLISLRALLDGELSDTEKNGSMAMKGYFKIENHYPLYIEDANW